MQTRPLPAGRAPVALALAALALQAHARHYTITDLGLDEMPLAINGSGQIAGRDAADEATVRRGAGWKVISAAPASALAINRQGDVVGVRAHAAVLWDRDGVVIEMPMPAPSADSSAEGVNGNGTVVGTYVSEAARLQRCFAWRADRGSADLGTMGGSQCLAHAVNGSGQVAGEATLADGSFHAFRYDEATGFRDLGVLPGGLWSRATAINAYGDVVGQAQTGRRAGHGHAVFYSVRFDELFDLDPNRAYAQSAALGINNRHDIVGYVSGHGEGRLRAASFQSSIVLLEDEVVDLGDWSLRIATATSDDGRIVGQGVRSDGRYHAFLLTPTGK